MNNETMTEKDWDSMMTSIYDYIFEVSPNEFKSYKRNNFHGTYLVHWNKKKVTKEVI